MWVGPPQALFTGTVLLPPTITSRKASNWVDRGEPPGPTLRRILAALFRRDVDTDARWLGEHAEVVLGMVAADATEVHVAGYLSVDRWQGVERVQMRIVDVAVG